MALPGLQKLNIPQNTASASFKKGATATNALKTAAAQGLATASKATGTTFKSTTTTYYGVKAQRSNVETIFNPKSYNGASIRMQIGQLNQQRNKFKLNDFWNNPTWANMQKASNNNGINQFAAGLMAVGMLSQMTAQTIEATKSIKSSGSTDALKGTDSSKGGADGKAVLTEMKGAKDSSTLRGAIETAKNNKSQMESDLKNIEKQLPEMQKASEAATKKLETLKPKLKNAEDAKNTAEKNMKDAESVKNANEKALKGAEDRLQGAKQGLTTAKQGLVTAKQGLGTAKAQLASTPQTDANGNPNPAYAQAQQAVKAAEEQVKQAEEAFDKANNEYNAANDADAQAKKDYEQATKQLANSEENLAQKTETYNEAKKEYDSIADEVKNAEKQKTDYDTAVKKQSDLQANIKSLETEIPAQEKRLGELESKEAKGLGAAENTVLKMQNKLTGKDGISGTDDDKKKLSAGDQKKLDNAKNLQRNIGYTQLYKTNGETIDGKTFRTGSYNGETLYMIGAKKVDERTYNTARKLAETAQQGSSQIANNTLRNGVNPEMQKRMMGA